MHPLALALLLAASPLQGDEPSPVPAEETEAWPDVEEPPRLDLELWAGEAWADAGNGERSEAYAAEATWRFDPLDVGLFVGRYQLREAGTDGSSRSWIAPVYLLRIGQRFETRNGLLASFSIGAGAVKTADWRSWFQVALGARASYGPAFIAGELSFESENLVRLSLGLGVSVL